MIERRGLGHAFSFVKDLLKERSLNELFIFHRAILVSSDMRYARKVILAFIVSTISR